MGRVAPMIRRVIETLRLPKKNGIAASLMDYARFNYIAQPGDKEFDLFARWVLTIIMR
jgi:hypothetical protein